MGLPEAGEASNKPDIPFVGCPRVAQEATAVQEAWDLMLSFVDPSPSRMVMP